MFSTSVYFRLQKEAAFAWRLGLLVIPILFSGCASTYYSTSVDCSTFFTVGEKIMVAEMEDISATTSYELYNRSKEVLAKAGLESGYAVEEELHLRLYQVDTGRPDSGSLRNLKEHLGYDYLLVPSVTGRKSGERFAQYDPEEHQYFSEIEAYEETDSKATVDFKLYSASTGKLIFQLAANTTISALALPKDDGEKNLYNYASAEDAMFKAYRKGLKKIMKECECCSGLKL